MKLIFLNLRKYVRGGNRLSVYITRLPNQISRSRGYVIERANSQENLRMPIPIPILH